MERTEYEMSSIYQSYKQNSEGGSQGGSPKQQNEQLKTTMLAL